MTISAESSQSWLARHSSASLAGKDLPWLQQQRQLGLDLFARNGLPGVRDEQWRYTNLRALKNTVYSLSTPARDTTVTLPVCDNPRLVFVDGYYRDDLSSVNDFVADAGVIFGNLAGRLTTDPAALEPYFGNSLPQQQHGFTALNTAYCQDGFVLILPNNAVLKDTLEICFVSSDELAGTLDSVSYSRNLIIANTNSQCTLIEKHIGVDGSVYLNNTVTEIHAGNNSHIDHYTLQQESADAFHVGGVFIRQSANSHVKSHNIALSGLVTRKDIISNLLGQGAHIELNGLVLGAGRQHVDNHTEVNHAVANCTSDEYYKTILDDHSRSVFRGRIIVAQDAQQTSADQQNKNLLLSRHAEADTKPQLEIYADDVQCSHGATVGQLDSKSLFYLRSRGIDKASANALLSFAFANEVIERIQVESVRTELTQIIAGQLLSGLEDLV